MVAFLLETLVIGAASDTSGASFGPRRFLELTPFAVLGLAGIATRIGPRFDWLTVGILCTWNLVLMANFEYVIGPSHATGYAALVQGQGTAVQYVPRLFAKGSVVRDLLLWSQAHVRFDPVRGLFILFLQAGCLAIAMAAALLGDGRVTASDRVPTAQGK